MIRATHPRAVHRSSRAVSTVGSAPFRIVAKIGIVALTGLGIYLEHQVHRPFKSVQEQAFEQWLADLDRLSLNNSERREIPAVDLTMSSTISEMPGVWTLRYDPERSSSIPLPKMLRILNLLDVHGFFSRFMEARNGEQHIFIKVEASGYRGEIALPADFVKNSIESRTLIRLFQIYADDASRETESELVKG